MTTLGLFDAPEPTADSTPETAAPEPTANAVSAVAPEAAAPEPSGPEHAADWHTRAEALSVDRAPAGDLTADRAPAGALTADRAPAPFPLTDEQRRIVEWDKGPVVVIAGAGTGKTRVIVERVRHLLQSHDDLLPEQLLVLTYNVKAAGELATRIEQVVGPATAARMTISNFHSFCQRVLTDSAVDSGIPPRPDVLDGVGQVLLLKDLRHTFDLRYHKDNSWTWVNLVGFINRAKDELVRPDDFDRYVAEERVAFEERFGSIDVALDRILELPEFRPLNSVRGAYAALRDHERAEARGAEREYDTEMVEKAAAREARRAVAGDGRARGRSWFAPEDLERVDALAATYVVDAAAIEILRLQEIAIIYRAYEAERARRGALDFGEQIAAVTQLFKARPNVLRRFQRQFRYLLVDEFQDANIAQIELIELLGRSPDRPDNVMVVGDDDQSIYRFRGASFAAFAEFDVRFSGPPAHAPDGPPPGPPSRLRLQQNFRSVGNVLTTATRLIGQNQIRYEPDKVLVTERPEGEPVTVITCAGPEDEAIAVVDAIKAIRSPGEGVGIPLSSIAVLYRKHRHREAIVARLRDEDIPYTVVGGLSLFETPEIRDLEQTLRVIADPNDDIALVRMMTAGPWRLDALEILAVTRPARDNERTVMAQAGVMVDHAEVDAGLRAKLRLLLDTIETLNPLAYREGPHTVLERLLERTSLILDLIAADTLEAKRMVTNIASLLRFAADWQAANPNGTLGGFVAYLDAYRDAGGELPTSVELTEDIEGVRLMTLYQAKGLEFPAVFVPQLLEAEWPTREGWAGLFPRELYREAVPAGDVHTEEERRLLYVAMTRAQERLVLLTHGGPTAKKRPSLFIGEIMWPGGSHIRLDDRTAGAAVTSFRGESAEGVQDLDDPDLDADPTTPPDGAVTAAAQVRRVMPLPTARERRLQLRWRAAELVGLIEGADPRDAETEAARERFEGELTGVARAAAMAADEARAEGLDPLTLRSVALDTGAGANLLEVASLPPTSSYSSLSTYEACPLQYAFKYVYRIPEPSEAAPALSFGSTAHAAFEAFTRERRERQARGEPPPTREDLQRAFDAEWKPAQYGDRLDRERYERRVGTLLDNFWTGELESLNEAILEEEPFKLVIDAEDGGEPIVITGKIDRINRLPDGGVEVIDYKTGRIESQKGVDESLQLSIYALACRDALGLGAPERVTLYFTESATRLSTTRSEEQLDRARDDVRMRVGRMRAGDFAANPGDACRYCDFRAMCPERA